MFKGNATPVMEFKPTRRRAPARSRGAGPTGVAHQASFPKIRPADVCVERRLSGRARSGSGTTEGF
jgi:hypothetical protein